MTKGKEKKKREHLGRPPKTVRAYTRATLEKLFVPGKEYTMAYICEQLDEKVPTNVRMRTRLWDQMELAGAVWERVQGSKYYLYKGLKDKPRDYDSYAAIVCAKKRIIDAFGINEQGYIVTDYVGYDDLCKIYYKKNIRELLLSQESNNKDNIEYKALTTLNRIIRINMYTLFWDDMRCWKRNAGHPEYNVLIPERRNQIIKRYRYNDAIDGMVISNNEMTETIEDKCRKGFIQGKGLLYGKRKNPYDYMRTQGIEVVGTVYKMQLIKDVPSKYYCNDQKVQKALEKRLQKTVYRYIRSTKYQKEIIIEDKYDRAQFDEKVLDYFLQWSASMEYSLNKIDYKELDEKSFIVNSRNAPTMLEGDLIIGENGDIEKNEDFITYEYEYELD